MLHFRPHFPWHSSLFFWHGDKSGKGLIPNFRVINFVSASPYVCLDSYKILLMITPHIFVAQKLDWLDGSCPNFSSKIEDDVDLA